MSFLKSPFAKEPPFKHGQAPRTAVLFCNLGTPDAPTTADVRRFLRELRDKGTVAHLTKDMATFTEWFDIVGMDSVKALEEKYGLPEEKRARY